MCGDGVRVRRASRYAAYRGYSRRTGVFVRIATESPFGPSSP